MSKNVFYIKRKWTRAIFLSSCKTSHLWFVIRFKVMFVCHVCKPCILFYNHSIPPNCTQAEAEVGEALESTHLEWMYSYGVDKCFSLVLGTHPKLVCSVWTQQGNFGSDMTASVSICWITSVGTSELSTHCHSAHAPFSPIHLVDLNWHGKLWVTWLCMSFLNSSYNRAYCTSLWPRPGIHILKHTSTHYLHMQSKDYFQVLTPSEPPQHPMNYPCIYTCTP